MKIPHKQQQHFVKVLGHTWANVNLQDRSGLWTTEIIQWKFSFVIICSHRHIFVLLLFGVLYLAYFLVCILDPY